MQVSVVCRLNAPPKDTAPKTVAIKQAPYSNEAEIEDMGNDPRRISIQAVLPGLTI